MRVMEPVRTVSFVYAIFASRLFGGQQSCEVETSFIIFSEATVFNKWLFKPHNNIDEDCINPYRDNFNNRN